MKRFLAMLLVVLMAVALVGCKTPANPDNPTNPTEATTPTENSGDQTNTEPPAEETPAPVVRPDTWARMDEEAVYNMALSKYTEMMAAAKAAPTNDERFVLYAQAEAYLLYSGVMIPTTTQGGAYQLSRIAYRTVPFVQWGNDDDRLHGLVISNEFITTQEREELKALWEAAVEGGTYDPAAYLTGKGHSILTDYVLTFQTAPATIDWLNTSSQSDTEITVNCVDGLVEYDNLGKMQPALAESWEVSDDGTVYTFHIRKGVQWFTSEGTAYAEVTAKDFEAGFRHMFDAKAGLDWLVDGVVKGVHEYVKEGGDWADVGYKATDDYTLVVTLEQPTSYFLTMLTYSCFLPMCESFYLSRGGVFGMDEYAEAVADTNAYTFGKAGDVSSQVYCGPFLLRKLQKDSEIYIVKNPNYYKADEVTLNSVKWIFDDGSNPTAFYNDVVKGTYAGCALTAASGLLDMAKADGNFDKYAYVSDTTSTTFFGGLNLCRGTFELEGGAVASKKTEDQKIDTQLAMLNQNFRLALQYSFDKATHNAVSRGEDLKLTNLRNMYTHPEFVQLEKETADADGHTFPAGTFYGDIVQYYVTQLGMPIDVHDGVNGWYHPEEAKACLEKAVAELGDAVNWPIHIDVFYGSYNPIMTNQAEAYKQVIEGVLGTDRVVVDLVEATTEDDYMNSGYRAAHGVNGNYDMFYGSGWGPDFGDPCTYLDTFLPLGQGYMAKVIGLF